MNISNLNKDVNRYKEDVHFINLEKILALPGDYSGIKRSNFLLFQIKNFFNKKPRCPEEILRECILLNSVSPKGYRIIRNRNIILLPSKMTIHRYLGPVVSDTGITTLIQTRLKEEAKDLKLEEKFCFLIIDEMSVKSQCIYDAKLDCIFGPKSAFNSRKSDLHNPANRMLCFLLYGLSSKICVPCAYYFTKQLLGKELYDLTLQVIKSVEECGFHIIRIVTDNYKTNVAMFKLFGNGIFKVQVDHPVNPERPLFVSFDQNHLIKNIRSLFLEKDMFDGHDMISGKYLKLLYKLQRGENIKAVRNLTFRHINPTSLEKMNVRRAVLIFSPPVVAALKSLHENSGKYPKAEQFQNASATIKFLQHVYKWFSIHDICNRDQYIYSRNSDKMHFISSDDERLQWLEAGFLKYMEETKEACSSHIPPMSFLTKETYEALILTTKSTIACVKYLLTNGYFYVLTRAFNSDAVESLFSSLRQMSGGNDMLDVRATIFSMEKILKVGIIESSNYSSTGSFRYAYKKMIRSNTQQYTVTDSNNEHLMMILRALHKEPVAPRASLKTGGLAYVAGYVVKTIEECIDCSACIDSLSTAKAPSSVCSFIYHQDRGGLRYPTASFISVLEIIQTFTEQAIKFLPHTNIYKNLENHILPNLMKSPLLKCTYQTHTETLCIHICKKFIPLLLKNIANNIPVKSYVQIKPLNRKILKLS